jgi:hypothetical protein
MTKYNVLISYAVEAEDEMRAVFALNKSLMPLSESELSKFDAFLRGGYTILQEKLESKELEPILWELLNEIEEK